MQTKLRIRGECQSCCDTQAETEIIGELERAVQAKDELLVAYRLDCRPKEKTFDALKRWEDFNK